MANPSASAPTLALINRIKSGALRTAPTKILALLQHTLRFAPRAAKYTTILLLILNAGSFPLVWHARVWSRVFELYFALYWHKITHFYLGKEQKRAALRAWYESLIPIGLHPFRAEWKYDWRVGFDDSDFNLHMSNSSYAKALDSTRMRLALATFPNVFRCGGWCPLAATHFHFIREIPMLSTYQVRVTIGAWDNKWLTRACRFGGSVASSSPRPRNRRSPRPKKALQNATAAATPQGKEAFIPSITTPATPLGATTPLVNGNGIGTSDPNAVSRALLEQAARTTEPDGALLYTVSVSQLCYKQGRITIPPAIVLAANGFYAAPDGSNSNFITGMRGVPPPHWSTVRAVTASMPGLAKFYAGGWRDVPEGERWWEDAFAACEEERRARLVPFVGSELENGGMVDARKSGLSGGLEGVRRIVTGAV
ncbi:Peptidase A1 domain-containing protein [Mycena sanguinolenta]|uniref:Peptidase A1 domain-containing protein n=1 Tax=Mycena sanguinolenta TaxID=230812 RepID=A0A8H6XBA5_9AGAR|nr:Peptidase A1 domain-containing protein [Mycena sanguinolenta]